MTRFDFQIDLILHNHGFFIQPDLLTVREIAKLVETEHFDDMAAIVIDKVTNIVRYEIDPHVYGEEFWQSPEETLSFKHGDCLDMSVVGSSIFHYLGIPHRIVFGFLADDTTVGARRASAQKSTGHAWLEFIEDGRWIYLMEFTKPYLFILDGNEEDPYRDTWYWPEASIEFDFV